MSIAVKSYLATLIAFLIIDALWIGFVAKGIYENALGVLMREQPLALAALTFYAVYAAGIVYFAVLPALTQSSIYTALTNGAFLGLLAYGTFSVTNFAVLSAWTAKLLVTDVLWGAAITAASAVVGYLAAGSTYSS